MQQRMLRLSAVAVTLAVVAGACQSDGDDDGTDATIAGTPIEEPTTVTDDSNEPTTATTEAATTEPADDTADEPEPADESPDLTLATLVLDTSPEKATPPTVLLGEPSTESIYEVGSIDPGLAPFVDMAIEHLSDRLGVEPESIEVLTAVLVTWPDSALGCREPDRAYAPVLTDGSVIELGADGLVYRYHSGGDRTPFPCDLPLNPVPPPLS